MCVCDSLEYKDFINSDVGHVVTGDMKIFKHPRLIKITEFGPKFREPVSVDFDKVYSHCSIKVFEFLNKWSKFESIALSVFNGWYDKFKSLLQTSISDLKCRYSERKKISSVFKDKYVSECLKDIHDKFVVCPVDKASKHFAVVCKRF